MPLTGGQKQASVMRSHQLFHKQLQSLNNDNSIRIECLSAAQTHSDQKRHMTEVAAYFKSLCYGPLRDR